MSRIRIEGSSPNCFNETNRKCKSRATGGTEKQQNVMKNQRLKALTLATAAVLGFNLSARAAVDMTFTWSGTYYEAGYTAQYVSSPDAIGIYAFTINDDGGTGLSSPFYSVCLSPAGLLDSNPHTYNVLPFNAANPGIYPSGWAWNGSSSNPQYWGIQNAAYLWNQFGLSIANNVGSIGFQNQRAAALEFAIWTSLYNSTGYGALGANTWAAPTGQMDATTLSYYNQYVNALTSASSIPLYTGNILEGTGAISGGADSGQSQEFLMLGAAVPEPTTMIAGALLLIPFGASTLRFGRRSRAAV
jgi:hypothetical protein